jgi:hypothetical protein
MAGVQNAIMFLVFAVAILLVAMIYFVYKCLKRQAEDQDWEETATEMTAVNNSTSVPLLANDYQQEASLAPSTSQDNPAYTYSGIGASNVTTRTTFEDKIVCVTGQSKANVESVSDALRRCAPGCIVRDLSMLDSDLMNPTTKFSTVDIKSLAMVIVVFDCSGVRLPLIGDGGKLDPLVNMLISLGVPEEGLTFVGTNETKAVDLGSQMYPQNVLRRLGSEQYNALKQWCLNGRFFVWHKESSTQQQNGLAQCLEMSQLLEFGTRPNGGGTFGCCTVCGAMLLDKEDKLCAKHSNGHCPTCGTQFDVDATVCHDCGFSDMDSFGMQELLKEAGPDSQQQSTGSRKNKNEVVFELLDDPSDRVDNDSDLLQTGMRILGEDDDENGMESL